MNTYQVYHYCGVVVGGAYPNHYLPFDMKATAERGTVERGEDTRCFLEECLQGKHGNISDENRVWILSFHRILRGICPYFVLVGQPQPLNENTDFCATVLKECDIDTRKSRNAVLLNVSKDGVSCEVEYNFGIIVWYLNGENSCLALTDTNKNVKNAR